MDSYKLIEQLQQAWNTLDVTCIEKSLDNDFEYGSQSVLSNIYGKENYLEYLKAKFEAIKLSGEKVTAKVGKYKNNYCLLIIQELKEPEFDGGKVWNGKEFQKHYVTERKGVLLLEFKDDLISKAHMCSIAPTERDLNFNFVAP